MKKICVVSGSRADYGLLYPLLKKLSVCRSLQLQIVATGMHLSPEFGLTFREILADGFVLTEKVEMLLSSDTAEGIATSTGLGMIGFAGAFQRIRPDLVVILGDRFEMFSAAAAAHFARIPIAHIHGGELTSGAVDDALRHSITKMSLLHFASTSCYRRRIIQMGESPERVFDVGALGVDNARNCRLLSRFQLQRRLGLTLGKQNILVTFHPATLERESSSGQFKRLLAALDDFPQAAVLFTRPNADSDSRALVGLIDGFVRRHPGRAFSFVSLGRVVYLSLMRQVDVVLGNSSSGIIEAPSFGLATVNVGDRQQGRVRAGSVIDCRADADDIRRALKKALSPSWKRLSSRVKNPYGDGRASEKIVKLLLRHLRGQLSVKKSFYDLKHVRS